MRRIADEEPRGAQRRGQGELLRYCESVMLGKRTGSAARCLPVYAAMLVLHACSEEGVSERDQELLLMQARNF